MGQSKKNMTASDNFVSMSRQQFRNYFQPSRILLGVIPAPTPSGINIITLCFAMHCSYKPPMLAVAVQNINASFDLIQKTNEYVLSVPGQGMINETTFCGLNSMKDVPDKATQLHLELIPSVRISVPGLAQAIANVEMVKEHSIMTGDHILVVGRAVNFRVNKQYKDLPLLSIGPYLSGYTLLAHNGIHRIGIVSAKEGRPSEERWICDRLG
jgi:flavin reductase (DIM6/NTAB) family NADH-FMN oxidoreductase RutF